MSDLPHLLISSSICTPTHAMSDDHLSKSDEMIREDSSTQICSKKELCAEGSLTVELIFTWVRQQPMQTMKEEAAEQIPWILLSSFFWFFLVFLLANPTEGQWIKASLDTYSQKVSHLRRVESSFWGTKRKCLPYSARRLQMFKFPMIISQVILFSEMLLSSLS